MDELTSPKLVIFLRHPESSKNVFERFSTADGDECITDNGEFQTRKLIESLKKIISRDGTNLNIECCVVCSTSKRAEGAAAMLSSALNCNIICDADLNPILGGQVAGMSEAEAQKCDPEFMLWLELYRAGVANSYDLTSYGENVHSFEERVWNALERIISLKNEIVFVVAHRSSITASLILLARLSLGYPSGFYGYIPLNLGCASAVLYDSAGNFQWIGVNISPEDLENRLTIETLSV